MWAASPCVLRKLIARALKHLLPVFGARLLCDISADVIARYQRKRRQDGVEGRTINMELEALRQTLRAYRLWDAVAPDAHVLAERRDTGRALTQDEEGRLWEATKRTDSGCYTAVVLALNTAVRKDVTRNLRWTQIDWEKHTVTVGKSKTAAGTGRVIPLNQAAFAWTPSGAPWTPSPKLQSRPFLSLVCTKTVTKLRKAIS